MLGNVAWLRCPLSKKVVCNSRRFGLTLAAQLSVRLTPACISFFCGEWGCDFRRTRYEKFLLALTSYPLSGCASAEPDSVSLDLYWLVSFCPVMP